MNPRFSSAKPRPGIVRFVCNSRVLRGALLAAGPGHAQTLPSAPATPPAVAYETIEMSPFTVTSDRDVGYLRSEERRVGKEWEARRREDHWQGGTARARS